MPQHNAVALVKRFLETYEAERDTPVPVLTKELITLLALAEEQRGCDVTKT